MAKDKKKSAIFADIGDRLNEIVKHYSKIHKNNEIYDESAKKLDISQLIPKRELSKLLQTVTSTNVYGNSIFEKFFDIQMGRAARYAEYEQILYRIPEASHALQIYVDSILAPNVGDRDNQMKFNTYNNDLISRKARAEANILLDKSNFFDILPQVIYTALLYGDAFIELDPTSSGIRYILHTPKNCSILYDVKTDIEIGLLVQQQQSESKIVDMLSYIYPTLNVNMPNDVVSIVSNIYNSNSTEEKFVEKQIKELVEDLLRDQGAQYKYLSPKRYVKFSIFYNNMYYPYGTSLFDSIRSIAKQLLLIEAALSIYRATRTPLRTIWNIEVGATPESEIPSLINGIMNKVRRQKVIDPELEGTTSLDSIPEIMSLEEDIWSPSINGQPLIKVDNLPGGDISPYINDAEYFKKKLIGALGIPPAYLAEEQGASTRALLTLEDIKFSRTVKKYQSDINQALTDLIDICFILVGHSELCGKVKLSLPEPKNIEDNIRIENINNRLSVADNFLNLFPNVPKLWVLKNIVGLTDDDIDEMEDAVEDQKKYVILSEQEFGNDEEEEGGRVGGGMSSFEEGLDLGPEEEPLPFEEEFEEGPEEARG